MTVRLVSFEPHGLIVESRWRGRGTIAYGEILTAERLRGRRGLRLHTRTAEQPIGLTYPGRERSVIENELRHRGVRIVDAWGAMITPTLADFEAELARRPGHVRQSSDNA